MSSMDFTTTVRQIFGDLDDDAEPFVGFDVCFTMPDKSRRLLEDRTAHSF